MTHEYLRSASLPAPSLCFLGVCGRSLAGERGRRKPWQWPGSIPLAGGVLPHFGRGNVHVAALPGGTCIHAALAGPGGIPGRPRVAVTKQSHFWILCSWQRVRRDRAGTGLMVSDRARERVSALGRALALRSAASSSIPSSVLLSAFGLSHSSCPRPPSELLTSLPCRCPPEPGARSSTEACVLCSLFADRGACTRERRRLYHYPPLVDGETSEREGDLLGITELQRWQAREQSLEHQRCVCAPHRVSPPSPHLSGRFSGLPPGPAHLWMRGRRLVAG